MEERTKITEIKENFTQKRRSKDASGAVIFEDKNFTRYKEVIYVEGWARFGHFMLDRVFFYIFATIFGVFLGIFLGVIRATEFLRSEYFSLTINFFTYLILYPLYYFIFELTMQSTPGKLILGRVVVNEYGEKPTFIQILQRSFSLIVPFEVFSCLSTLGWHDTWTDTMVIRKKDLKELELAIKTQNFGDNTIIL
jgi:uncharacterized RDD family membrane protein YckC